MVSNDPPIKLNAPIAATDTSAAIRPYSMAVAPDAYMREGNILIEDLVDAGVHHARFCYRLADGDADAHHGIDKIFD